MKFKDAVAEFSSAQVGTRAPTTREWYKKRLTILTPTGAVITPSNLARFVFSRLQNE